MSTLLAQWDRHDGFSYNANDIAQTFTPTPGYDRIDQVQLVLSKTGSVSGNVDVHIYATSGGVPTGGSLGSASLAASSIGSEAWYTFTFGTPVAISSGVKYAIVKIDNTNGSANINWWRSTNPDYPDGQGFYLSGSWIDYSRDFGFKVYGYQSATPPSVTTGTIGASPTQTTLDAAGNVTSDGGATISERGFAYNTAGTPTIYDSKLIVAGTTGAYSGTLTGLTGGTTYYVRAYATNSQGTSYGAQGSGVTSTNPPSVTTTGIVNVTATTATGQGNVTNDNGAAVTERGIVYKTSATPTTADNKVVASTGGTGSYEVNITGLSPNTTYHTRAYAINSQGTSYGAEVDFTTKDIVVAWAQQFTATTTGTLSKVNLYLRLNQGSSATATVKIYSDTANAPGTLLATYSKTITNAAYEWVEFTTSVAVTNASKYWVVLDTPYVIGSYEIYLGADSAGTYGLLKYQLSSAGTWVAQTDNATFKVYMQPAITINANNKVSYKKRYI